MAERNKTDVQEYALVDALPENGTHFTSPKATGQSGSMSSARLDFR